MRENVIYITHAEKKERSKRSNTLYDAKTFSGSNYTLDWNEAVEIYLQTKRSETISNRTLEYEKANLKSYQRILEEQYIKVCLYTISVDLMRKSFVIYMVDVKKYALNTINNRITSEKRFFTFLHKEGWVPINPTTLKNSEGAPSYHFMPFLTLRDFFSGLKINRLSSLLLNGSIKYLILWNSIVNYNLLGNSCLFNSCTTTYRSI
jgi:hypothetical protein